MKTLILWLLIASTSFATDYSGFNKTDYSGLVDTDYSWAEKPKTGRFDALRPIVKESLTVPVFLDLEKCEKIPVWIYTSDSCPYCDIAKDEIAGIPWIKLIEKKTHPSWVKALPTLHWATESGEGRSMVGWSKGRSAELIERLNKDRPAASKTIENEVAESAGYPLRGGWWSVNGIWNPSREYLIDHLLNGSEHRGKFSQSYLSSMTYSEMMSLHSDCHEGRVKYNGTPKTSAVVRAAETSYCPTGNCPTARTQRVKSQRKRFLGIF